MVLGKGCRAAGGVWIREPGEAEPQGVRASEPRCYVPSTSHLPAPPPVTDSDNQGTKVESPRGSPARKPLIVLLEVSEEGGLPFPLLPPRHAGLAVASGNGVRPHAIPFAKRSVCMCVRAGVRARVFVCVVSVVCGEEGWGWDFVTSPAPPPGVYKGRLARNDPEQQL